MIKSAHANILESSTVSLAAGAEDTNFPLHRLYDRNIGRLFKSTLAETVEILADQGAEVKDIDRLLIPVGHNLEGICFDLRHSDDDATYLSVLGTDEFGSETDQDLSYRTEESDEFGISTRQNLKTGGDGAKQYGWNVLNSANTDNIDVDISNAGRLTIDCNDVNTKLANADFEVPFIYKSLTGDFDIESSHTDNGDQNYEDSGLLVRDLNASAGEDWVGIFFRAADGKTWWGDTTNSASAWEYDVAAHRFFRIKRSGTILTLYSRADSGDPWMQRSQFNRSDFGATVQAGVFARTGNTANNFVVQFDWFHSRGDGVKQHGWNVLNSEYADSIDVNQTNAGILTIDCNERNSKLGGMDFSLPFIYKELAGDFDIATSHTDNGDQNFEDAGLLVRDPAASGGENWVGIFFRAADGKVWRGDTANSVSGWESDVAAHRIFRIRRSGDVFTFYSKAGMGDAWTQRSQFMRNDFASMVQVGVFARTGNANNDFVVQFDWFRHVAPSDLIDKSFSTPASRYWKLVILEPPVRPEIPEVFLTETYSWSRDPSRPAGPFEPVFNVDNDVTSGGQDRFLVHGAPKRRRFYHMPRCGEAHKDAIVALYDAWAGSKPFWLCDHGGVWIYGKLRSPLGLEEAAYRKYRFDFDFLEVLP